MVFQCMSSTRHTWNYVFIALLSLFVAASPGDVKVKNIIKPKKVKSPQVGGKSGQHSTVLGLSMTPKQAWLTFSPDYQPYNVFTGSSVVSLGVVLPNA